jgi:hypothetical protein
MTAAELVVSPIETTHPALLPLIDDTMMPAMPQTKITAHNQRSTRTLVAAVID